MAHLPLEVEISGKDTQKWMILVDPLNQRVKLVPEGAYFGSKRAILAQFAPRSGKYKQILRSG
jgi:hypothetical protein